jgi:heat shock protein HslJ
MKLSPVVLASLMSCAGLLTLVGCGGAGEAGSDGTPRASSSADPRNTTYRIDETDVTLVDGMDERPAAPGSSSKILTKVWGGSTLADLNGDGVDDAVLILTQETGGSGTFFYLAAAVAAPAGYVGTAGLLLGDRIDPKSVSVQDGTVTFTYMTHGANQSFAEEPAVEVVRRAILSEDGLRLVEVPQDSDGEADSTAVSLQSKTWVWLRTTYNNDTVEQPREPDAFTLTFADDTVQGTTDCNSFRGGYSRSENRIAFDDRMATTRMYCADAQESEFLQMLQNVQSYFFTDEGLLILELRYDSGSMIFR